MKFRVGSYRFNASIFIIAVFIGLFSFLITLGFWQLSRADEKRQIQQLKNTGINNQVLDLPIDLPIDLDIFRYRKVKVSGHYDSNHQILIDNQIRKGKSGYFVLTPVKFSGSSKAVLVNRGWVLADNDRTRLPEISLVNIQDISISGRINAFPKPGIKLKGADIPSEGWPAVVQIINIDLISKKLGYPVHNFQIELDAELAQGFYRRWHEAKLITPQKHTAYAFQWFALALTLLGLFLWHSIEKRINE